MVEKGKISKEPYLELLKTLEEAENKNLVDWNAMNIATVSQTGQPSSRMVLLKKISDQGISFYSNFSSRKGKEIDLNAKVAVNFWWRELKKQIRIEGVISKASDQDSDAYFDSRPIKSRVSAIISNQSSKIDNFISKKPKLKITSQTEDISPNVNPEVISDTGFMTETLAKLYLSQKNYEKAIQSYKILSLKFPEKNSYFADQIKRIKKLK